MRRSPGATGCGFTPLIYRIEDDIEHAARGSRAREHSVWMGRKASAATFM